jgi:hypothetical protein
MKIARYLRMLLLAAAVLAVPASSYAGIFIGISIGIAPPPLPVYAQPVIPAEGYIWTPGYWAWSDDGGYYWVPGTWVQPPQVGFLWTPAYWGWNNGVYVFNEGYWGPHIGFYGGINYGFGYGGSGYEGGYWNNGHFAYNTSVNNVTNVHITNVYNHTVINNTTVNNVSFNGGTGGVQARATAQEQAAAHENHVQATQIQMQHISAARSNPQLRASVNGGKPAIAATSRPGDFKSAVPARQAGGQVDSGVYKAAAENHGKLPTGMKDPGSVRPSSASMARPNNGAEANNRPANATENRPAAAENRSQPAARPNAESARPATEAPRPQPKPEAQARPAAQPRPEAKPEQQPRPQPQSRPAPAPKPRPAARPAPEHEEKPK